MEGLLASYCKVKTSPVLARAFLEPPDLFFANYIFSAPILDFLPPRCKRILETHDLLTYQYLAQERYFACDAPPEPLESARKRYLFQFEMNVYNFYDAAIMCQPDELAEARAAQNANLHYVPRMHPLAEQSAHRNTEQPIDLLFVASDNYFNQEGIEWFHRHVYEPYLSSHHVRLGLAGRICGHVKFDGPNVSKLGHIRGGIEELRKVYNRAKLVIVPMRRGTGVSIKTLEALGMGCAVVSTPVGARGLRDVREAMVCLDMEADPKATAVRILRLLASDTERHALETAALSYMRKHHSREAFYRSMDAVMESVGISPTGMA